MCTSNKNFNTYMKGNFWGNPSFWKGKFEVTLPYDIQAPLHIYSLFTPRYSTLPTYCKMSDMGGLRKALHKFVTRIWIQWRDIETLMWYVRILHWWHSSDLQSRQVAFRKWYQWKLKTLTLKGGILRTQGDSYACTKKLPLVAKALKKKAHNTIAIIALWNANHTKLTPDVRDLSWSWQNMALTRQQVVHNSWCSLLRTNWPSSVALVCTFSCQME